MSSNRDRKKKLKKEAQSLTVCASVQPVQSQSRLAEERTANDSVSIIRHRTGNLETFELTESELDKIENDIWGGRYFDFAITSVTLGITILIFLLSCDSINNYVRTVFIALLIICMFVCPVCFYKAYTRHHERKELFRRIRER